MTEAPKRALAGGEIDPDLWHASDLNPVRVGAAKIENFIVRQRGGIERTPGTEHVAIAKTAARIRLGAFARSSAAAYLAEYGPEYARIYDADMDAGAAQVDEVATPFLADDLIYLQWAQSNDVQFIFSGRQVQELRRTAPGGVIGFDMVPAEIKNGPFLDQNTDQTLTLQASAVTGAAITLTASAALFEAGHVGAFFRLAEGDTGLDTLWGPGKAVALDARRRFNGRVYRVATAGTTTVYPPEHEIGARDDGDAVVWEYLHSGYGIVRITAIVSATEATAEVIKRLPDQVVSGPSYRWSEGAWSARRGYPVAGAFYKNALWAAGSEHEPARLWKSAIDGFNDFEPGVLDDSALTRDLVDGATEAVRWMAPSKVLTIGTDGPEWVARPDNSSDTVRLNNLRTEVATDEGASDVPGIAIGGVTVFTDASRRRLTSMFYEFRTENWAPRELSLLAAHILGRGVVEMVYQRNPWPLIWCLLEDGTLAALTYLPDQEVLAWHRHDFGDPVESIAVLPVEGGRRETLFLAVRRDGAVHIERMFDRFRPETGQGIAAARQLFAAKTYDLAEPATVFAGLGHLEGREVIALVDGNSHPPVTVQAGAVTLNFAGRNVVIGLRYTSRYQTLPFDMGMPDEAQTPKNKRLRDLALAFRATMGGRVEIGSKVQEVFKLGASPLDAAPALKTGVVKVFPPAADDAGQLAYVNDTAWPATVTAIFPEYEV